MAKIRARNPFIIRVFTTIFVLCLIAAVLFYSYKMLINNVSVKVYDLGKKGDITDYKDAVIESYTDYLEIIKKYNLPEEIPENIFQNNKYIATFQEYDTCAEKKFKTYKSSVTSSDVITLNFVVHNQCGLCENHLTLYLIKVDNVPNTITIKSNYSYENQVNDCGVVK